jgi:hypothetical protein
MNVAIVLHWFIDTKVESSGRSDKLFNQPYSHECAAGVIGCRIANKWESKICRDYRFIQ